MEENKKENIWNIPNFFTALRVVIALLLIYLIFAGYGIISIIVFFVAGMITDALDGQIARRLKMTTEFGRKFDMIADRVLMLGTTLPFVIKFVASGLFTNYHLVQIILILSREIITSPFAVWGMFTKRAFPQIRLSGKVTTVLQAIAFPAIALSVFYSQFNFSLYLAILTSIAGAITAFYYIRDIIKGK